MKQYLFRLTSLAVGLFVACGAFAAAGGTAQADVIATSACDNAALTQPFLPWGDVDQYKLVPGGTFEAGAPGWTLSGGARIVDGSEPFGVTGSVGTRSLYLPAGASAQSPDTCVNAAYPLFRFFGRNSGLLSTLLVQVVYQTPLHVTVVLPVGVVALSGAWEPTLPMITGSLLTGALDGGTAQVALRFTALTGSSQVDDVFVDPRMSA